VEFVRAVERGDLARLSAIPGIGKKMSERIVLELKDRLPRTSAVVEPGQPAAEAPPLRDDLLSALMNLGYHRPLAEKAVDAAIKATTGGTFEQTLKRALRELSNT
jgi:Holliday junction DNA helicase RuvA